MEWVRFFKKMYEEQEKALKTSSTVRTGKSVSEHAIIFR